MEITRHGRWQVEDFSEHNEQPEAFQNAANKSKELGRPVTITPPSYEVDNVEVFEQFAPQAQGGGGVTVSLSGNEILYDDFNYTAGRDGAENVSRTNNGFVNNGPWGDMKDDGNASGSNGYLYTSTNTSLVGGSIPNLAGTHYLVVESTSGTNASQSDIFLEPSGMGTLGDVPADVWFLFTMYPVNTGSYPAYPNNRLKFIYPNKAASYPASSLEWLFELGNWSANPHCDYALPGGYGYFSHDSTGSFGASTDCAGGAQKLGHTLDNGGQIEDVLNYNEWQQLKVHFDTSQSAGKMEVWRRGRGESWTQTHNWEGGVTPSGFTWTPVNSSGHAIVRFITSIPGNNNPSENADCFLFIADIAMATGTNSGGNGDSDLPTYTGW